MREELAELDPYNRLLARQSRFRMDAELVRDNALAVSGLLVRDLGGRSVKPYQPAGLLRHLNFPHTNLSSTTAARTSIAAASIRIGSDNSCILRCSRSTRRPAKNARPSVLARTRRWPRLVLLNDPSYVEAARVFAERISAERQRKRCRTDRRSVCSKH